MKFISIKSLRLFFIMATCIFIYSCSENLDNYSPDTLYDSYLHIDNFSTKTAFTIQEKSILKEANERVKKAIEIKDSKYVVGKTSMQLNISEDIYTVFCDMVELGNMQKISLKPSRTRSGSPENDNSENDLDLPNPCDFAQDTVNDYFNDKPAGDFSNECFNNYWNGGGDSMTLSENRFSDISSYIPTPSSFDGMQQVSINGETYYKSAVSFYDTPYNYSLGTATITYDSNFQPVGLSDEYDFNHGDRDLLPEAITRVIGAAGNACGAESYSISYGIH